MASEIRVYCIDGPRIGREYFFPLLTPEFQINAIMPGGSPFDPPYYAGLIYKIVPAGFGVCHGVFVRKAERAR